MGTDSYYSIKGTRKSIWLIEDLIKNQEIVEENIEKYQLALNSSGWFKDSKPSYTVQEIVNLSNKVLNNQIDIIDLDKKVASHCSRVINSDLQMPIVVLKLKDDFDIIDGYHRIAKAYLHGIKKIKVVGILQMPKPNKIEEL